MIVHEFVLANLDRKVRKFQKVWIEKMGQLNNEKEAIQLEDAFGWQRSRSLKRW